MGIPKIESKRNNGLQSRHTNKRHLPHFVKNTPKNKPFKKVLFKSIQNFSKKKAKNRPPKYKKLKKKQSTCKRNCLTVKSLAKRIKVLERKTKTIRTLDRLAKQVDRNFKNFKKNQVTVNGRFSKRFGNLTLSFNQFSNQFQGKLSDIEKILNNLTDIILNNEIRINELEKSISSSSIPTTVSTTA